MTRPRRIVALGGGVTRTAEGVREDPLPARLLAPTVRREARPDP